MPNDFTGYESLADSKGFLVEQSEGVALLDNVDAKSVAWKIPHGAQDDCVEWVKKNRLSVTNASFRKCQLKGLWRSSDLKINEAGERQNEVMLIQTFRRGYAATAIDKEAFVSAGDAVKNANGDEFTVTFPTIRPDIVDDVVASLKARPTATNPIFGRTHLTGTYIYSRVEDRVAIDGIHNIIVTLTKTAILTDEGLLDELDALDFLTESGNEEIANGEMEQGLHEWKTFTWKGLDNSNEERLLGIRDNVADFVNKFIAEVVAYSEPIVVGTLYEVPSGGTGWVARREGDVAVGRKVSVAPPIGIDTAIREAYLTDSWNLQPIVFKKGESGVGELIITAEQFTLENLNTATFVEYARRNPDGIGAGKTMVAKGTATTALEAILENLSAEDDHLLGRITIDDSGPTGIVTADNNSVYTYVVEGEGEAPDTLLDPVTKVTIYAIEGKKAKIISVWPRIAPAVYATNLALIISETTAGYVTEQIREDVDQDGAHSVTRYEVEDLGGATAFYYDLDQLYEHKRLYRNIGQTKYYADVLMRYRLKKGYPTVSGMGIYGERQGTTDPPEFDPGYAMEGSYFRDLGRNYYFFKKIYQMYSRDAGGEPDQKITMGDTVNLEWTEVSETKASS